MFSVEIRELEIYAYHGVPDEEQKIGHRYLLNVRMDVNGTADATDDVRDTVEYGALGKRLADAVATTQFRTLERLADHLASLVLDEQPLVARVEIDLAKRLPPAPILAAATAVRLVRSR